MQPVRNIRPGRQPFCAKVTFRLAVGIDRRPTLPDDLVWPPVLGGGEDLRPAETEEGEGGDDEVAEN